MENQTFQEWKIEKLEKKLGFWKGVSKALIIGLVASLGGTIIDSIYTPRPATQVSASTNKIVSQDEPEKYNPRPSIFPRDNRPEHYIPKE